MRRALALLSISLAIFTFLGCGSDSERRTLYVAPAGDGGIIGACYASIADALLDATDDVEYIKVAAGEYLGVTAVDGHTQALLITSSVTITGGYTIDNWGVADPAANVVTIDAQGLGRVVFIEPGLAVTLEGLVLTGGDATGLGGGVQNADAGGAVFAAGSDVSVFDCTITQNVASTTGAGYGGGVYVYGGSLGLQDSTITLNTASTAGNGYGGGVYLEPTLPGLVLNCAISANTATSAGAEGHGGGICLVNSADEIALTLISDNAAHDATLLSGGLGTGGGVAIVGGGPLLNCSTVRDNVASLHCGGYGGGTSAHDSPAAEISRCVYEGNAASHNAHGFGGGLYLERSSPAVSTCALIQNLSGLHTTSRGGAVAGYACSSEFTQCTVSDSSGGNGTAVYVDEATSTESAVTFVNTILVGSLVGIETAAGSTASLNGVLWHGIGTTAVGDVTLALEYTGAPLFASDGYHITGASAALDRGVPTLDVDIDGQPRTYGGAPDLGADEIVQ